MNTITKNTGRNLNIAFMAFVMIALSFAMAPKASATDLFDTPWIDTGYYDTWEPTYNSSYDTPWIDTGYYDTWEPTYYDNYSSGSMPSFGGFGGGSFFTGGGFMGGGYSAPGYTNVNTNVNTNTNTCTSGSCNTAINAPTNIVTNYPPAQQQVVYQPSYPTYPVVNPPVYNQCYTCGCPGYPACQRPIAYQSQPYVTLSQVPYTGLELGPVGTALYWGFLVLWCLIAAYLIAVKKVQNNIAAWFTSSTPSHAAPAHHAHVAHKAHAVHAPAHKPQHSGIDPFIQSQINRAK